MRKEVTLIKFAGKDSIVSIDGAAPVRANLTGGKLNVKDPAFRGDKITGSYLAKHKNPRGVDVNAMMVDLQTAKRDLVNVKALSATFEAFGPQMNDIAKIYPQMQRDLRNLRKGGKEIEDFMGYRVKKTDGGFEVTDVATGNATTMKNSGEVLNYVLPQAEKSGTKILTYKLQHLYDNMDAAKLEKILQRGKGVKKINGKMPAYEVSVDGVAYQVEFNSAI
ncbi:hypothetical protein KBC03_01610 [Patescibacteria group bacterium]|nr:hypothetical protein [Patescibacteria group bacterium]